MYNFPILFSFDKKVGDLNGRIEVIVTNEQILLSAMEEACTKIGLSCNENFRIFNSNGIALEINSSIENNGITKDNQLIISFFDIECKSQDIYNSPMVITKRLWKPLAIVGATLSIIGLIILITIYIISCLKIYSYGVIVDAGSTSSKIYLYSWTSNNFIYNADINQVSTCKTDNGISNYEDNPSMSFAEIKACLDKEIVPKIPKEKKSISYIFLGATAGMRMLSYKNPNASAEILNVLRKSLSTYALKINNTKSDINIISGTTEGLSGWITVNYLLDNYPKTGGESTTIIGAMDMGGASAQMTFLDSTPGNVTDTFSLNLYGKPYRVYSHSYLCYGKSQAELRFLAVLLYKNNFTLHTNNPCMFHGEEVVFQSEEIFFKPCVYGKFAVENYGFEIVPPQWLINKNINFTFNGTSDFNQCRELVNTLFNTSKCQNKTSCTFNGVYQPHLSGKFGAFSAYPMIKEHLNPKNKNYNLTSYQTQLITMCNNKRKPTSLTEDIFAKWLCFDLTFLIEMLIKIGLNDSNWKHLDFIKTIKNYNVGWSLGYMIHKTALIPKETHFLPLEDYMFAILVVVFVLIFIFAVVFMVLGVRNNAKEGVWPIHSCDINEEQNLLSSSKD